MSLPDGVTTCLLTYGPITDTFGNLADSIEVEVVADRTVIHAASGRTMFKNPVVVTADGGGIAQIAVPHTDQAGFRDQAQNALTGWYYTITLTARFGTSPQTDKKVAQFLVGQTTVDADLLPSNGMVTPGVTAPTATVTSVNGQTGAVVVEGGGGGSTDFTGDTEDEAFLTTKVDGDAVPRFTQRADGAMMWGDGEDDTNPRRVGLFHRRLASYDYGVGEPFLSGYVNLLVVGDPDDPEGFNIKTGDIGEVEQGYFMQVNGALQVRNAMAVFSDHQPFIVLGRLDMDNRYPELRPRGETEELSIGIAATTTDYFTDPQVGDVVIRAYGSGPGAAAAQRRRRILFGSNDGAQAEYGHSTMSIGSGDVQFYRPLNFINSAVADDDNLYVMVNGVRKKIALLDEPIQASDAFSGVNGHGLVSADTGQDYYIARGTWQRNGGKALALTLTSSKAVALLTINANSTVEADITTTPPINAATLCHRVVDGAAANFLMAVVTSTQVRIEKYINNADTVLASASTSAWPNATTHRLSFQAAGDDLTVKVDGVTVLTHTLTGGDATTFGLAAACGMVVFDTTTSFDNLTITV